MNKRGISEVLSNISLILITIALIGIITPLIIGLIKNNLNESSACSGMEDAIKFDNSFGYNCIRNGNNYLITVRTTNEKEVYEKIKKIDILLIGNSGAKSYTLPTNQDFTMINPTPPPSNDWPKIPPLGSARTYSIALSGNYNKMKITPIIEGDKRCDNNNEMEILEC